MPQRSASIDRVFHALADPTRLGVLTQLGKGPATVSQLAAPFDMALPSFMEHLEVLEETGLIKSKREGRARVCQLLPAGMKRAEKWLTSHRAARERREARA